MKAVTREQVEEYFEKYLKDKGLSINMHSTWDYGRSNDRGMIKCGSVTGSLREVIQFVLASDFDWYGEPGWISRTPNNVPSIGDLYEISRLEQEVKVLNDKLKALKAKYSM